MLEPSLAVRGQATSIGYPRLQLLQRLEHVSHGLFRFRHQVSTYRLCLVSSAARSNSARRASISSISIALLVRSRTMSAALRRVDAGTFGSTIVLRTVVTAALEA